jgi:DNA-binding SARP family transcriptional activator
MPTLSSEPASTTTSRQTAADAGFFALCVRNALRGETRALWDRLQRNGAKHVVALFVTPDEFAWVKSPSRTYTAWLYQIAQYEIGHYNRWVALDALEEDVLTAAFEQGWWR